MNEKKINPEQKQKLSSSKQLLKYAWAIAVSGLV